MLWIIFGVAGFWALVAKLCGACWTVTGGVFVVVGCIALIVMGMCRSASYNSGGG